MSNGGSPNIRALWLRNGAVWLALLLLLALSVGLAYSPLGGLNLAANLSIAAIMIGVVMFYFMELRRDSPLVRLTALGGVLWLLIMFWLTLNDYFTRLS